MITVGYRAFENLVGQDRTGVGESEQRMIREDAFNVEQLGMKESFVAKSREGL